MPVNDINQDQEYAFQSSEFMSLSYLISGGVWRIVPGVMDYNISGGSTPSRDVVAANAAVAKRVGRPRVGDVSISAYFMPTDIAWRYIREAQLNRTLVQWRIETNGDIVWRSAATLPCQASVSGGDVTFHSDAGDQPIPTLDTYSIGRGAVITVGSHNLIIDDVHGSANTLSTLDLADYETPDTIEASNDVIIWNPPPMRYEFSAYVTQGADSSMPSEGELTTNLSLTPRKPLPDPVIITEGNTLRPARGVNEGA